MDRRARRHRDPHQLLRGHRDRSDGAADALVFASATGTALDAHNVRRSFRRIVAAAGLDPAAWTPRLLLLTRSAPTHCPVGHLLGARRMPTELPGVLR